MRLIPSLSSTQHWVKEKAKAAPLRWVIGMSHQLGLDARIETALSRITQLINLPRAVANAAVERVNQIVRRIIAQLTTYLAYAYFSNPLRLQAAVEQINANGQAIGELAQRVNAQEKTAQDQQVISTLTIQFLLKQFADDPAAQAALKPIAELAETRMQEDSLEYKENTATQSSSPARITTIATPMPETPSSPSTTPSTETPKSWSAGYFADAPPQLTPPGRSTPDTQGDTIVISHQDYLP